jgi:hypothetical protein
MVIRGHLRYPHFAVFPLDSERLDFRDSARQYCGFCSSETGPQCCNSDCITIGCPKMFVEVGAKTIE